MVEKKETAAAQKKASVTTAKTATSKAAPAKAEAAKEPAAKTPAKTEARAKTAAKTSAKAEASKATGAKTAEKPAAKKTTAKGAAAKTAEKPAEVKAAAEKTTAAAKATAAKTAPAKKADAKPAEVKAAEVKVTVKKAEEKPVEAKSVVKKAAVAKATAAKATAVKAAAAKKASEKPARAKTAAKKAAGAKVAAAKATAAKKAVETIAVAKVAAAAKAEIVQAKAKSGATAASAAKAAGAKAAEAKAADEKAVESAAKTAAKVEKKTVSEVAKEAEGSKIAPKKAEPAKKAATAEKKPEPKGGSTEQAAKPDAQKANAAKPEFSDIPGVLIAAAECAPLVKVGGMADVVGALPKYLKKLGVEARVILPFHRQIKERYAEKAQHMADFQASLGWRSQYVGLERLELDGVVYYFIDNEFYFGGDIYCGGEIEGEQYAFFTRAVMDSIPLLDFDVRILHCNDWHTAMMPLLAKTQYQGGMQAGLRTVLTIHNLHFQGQFSREFDRDLLRVDDSLATPEFIEHYGCDNMLKAGIVFADKVNTVSPTYAREICEPYLGESLDGVLRSRGSDLWGILNGIDADVWNPQTDSCLPVHYSAKGLSGKMAVRDALLEELGLEPAGEETAVISMVGRLTPQKGIDLVQFVLDELMGEDIRFIILGAGYSEYEEFLRNAEGRHKGRLCSYIGYNADLSHRIYAGSDLFLMPSLFEPCGISQMIAMAYGTLPIVHETGGLKDTVMPYNEFTGEGNGFSFANYDAGEMLNVIRYALWIWRGGDARRRLMKQAMESDFSFDRCARTYAELYRTLV